jgi:ribonuclease P protein component
MPRRQPPASGGTARPPSGKPSEAPGCIRNVARLKRRREFLEVAGAGRKWVTPGLILQVLRHAGAAEEGAPAALRLGFTASRKVGIAVVRNRARRRLRAAAAEILPRHASSGHDYVLIARAATVDRPYAALVEDLRTALHRLGVWREEGVSAGSHSGPVGA